MGQTDKKSRSQLEPEAERTNKQPGCRDGTKPVPPIPPGTDRRTACPGLHEMTLLPTGLCSHQENLKKEPKTKELGTILGRGSVLESGPLISQYPPQFPAATSSERDCSKVAGSPECAPPQPLSPGSPAPPCGHLSPCSQVASDCPSSRASVSNLSMVEGQLPQNALKMSP